MNWELFIDQDGVLADFDQGYFDAFGYWPTKEPDNVDWPRIHATPNFFYNLQPMRDFEVLWKGVKQYRPTVLTGIPKSNWANVVNQKRRWLDTTIGNHQKMIPTVAREKCLYAHKRAILIDDTVKHRQMWVDAGGTWITHTSAKQTLKELAKIIEG